MSIKCSLEYNPTQRVLTLVSNQDPTMTRRLETFFSRMEKGRLYLTDPDTKKEFTPIFPSNNHPTSYLEISKLASTCHAILSGSTLLFEQIPTPTADSSPSVSSTLLSPNNPHLNTKTPGSEQNTSNLTSPYSATPAAPNHSFPGHHGAPRHLENENSGPNTTPHQEPINSKETQIQQQK